MFRIRPAIRVSLVAIAAGVFLSACTNSNDLDEPMKDLGQFRLGHDVVVASKMKKGPLSREATPEEFEAAMKAAVEERFRRYEGDQLYHFGISVEGYMLATPGIPLLFSPKSALIINVTIWDDAAGKKLNEEPHQITVLESFSKTTIMGSGLTLSKEEQMQNLTRNAAKEIQNWMLTNREWFGESMPETVAPAEAADDATTPEAAGAAPAGATPAGMAPVAAPVPAPAAETLQAG